ncbi:hypothetical protein K503DRAFT_784068 [Rhizopogon vinicolor AM-OR11-026]|uniref:Uncharacterized protein n=1 Tax=Rhizopogon vinicolor AM-OR11-026 TaxID=1314800 RepID=A0A1B7MW75_9AGAM|nr:hypothetical protein K503DRAFT_784068 [Rhizopogon vinicolor AM-OR11-026]
MHFSFLAVLAALTASVSVSACTTRYGACTDDTDCCHDLICLTYTANGNLTFARCNTIRLSVKSAIISRSRWQPEWHVATQTTHLDYVKTVVSTNDGENQKCETYKDQQPETWAVVAPKPQFPVTDNDNGFPVVKTRCVIVLLEQESAVRYNEVFNVTTRW